ncbi:MAG: matrixin family metalloprotease [Vicinamibacterales bacterium]
MPVTAAMRFRQLLLALLVPVAVLVPAAPSRASVAPRWSDAELTSRADIVVTGRVAAVTGGLDDAVDTIYSYVTVDVTAVLKGWLPESRIVVKQLGGAAGGLVLAVGGQARFAAGEEVLLFLSVRPRDGTLQTTAFWQGKWQVVTGADGLPAAERSDPDAPAPAERRPLAAFRRAIAALAGARPPGPGDARVRAVPPETPAAGAGGEGPRFVLFDPPWRWDDSPVPVDYEDGLEPGVPGSLANLARALERWSAVSAGIGLELGVPRRAHCLSAFEGTGRATVSFGDDCGELAGDALLAYAGVYYSAEVSQTVGGLAFRRVLEAFVMNNDSARARQFLASDGCFQDIQLHELGHVLGLNHSTVAGAVMRSSIDTGCFAAPHALSADDRAGLLRIYPDRAVPGTPGDVRVSVHGTASLTVSWSAPGAGAAPTSYRVDFAAAGGGLPVARVPATATTLTVGIPAGTAGTFSATVRALNDTTPGAASAPVAFTIGSSGPGPCATAPAAPAGVSASASGGVATVRWTASAGATSYIVQAGSTSGGTDIYDADVGANTTVSASVPAGFFAYVQVRAVNRCGTSAASAPVTLSADPRALPGAASSGFHPGGR